MPTLFQGPKLREFIETKIEYWMGLEIKRTLARGVPACEAPCLLVRSVRLYKALAK